MAAGHALTCARPLLLVGLVRCGFPPNAQRPASQGVVAGGEAPRRSPAQAEVKCAVEPPVCHDPVCEQPAAECECACAHVCNTFHTMFFFILKHFLQIKKITVQKINSHI